VVRRRKSARLIREAERRLNSSLPKIIGRSAVGFKSLHERAHCGRRDICKPVATGIMAAHCIYKWPQRLDRFGDRETSCPVKDIKDIAGELRQRLFMFKNRVGTQALSNGLMSLLDCRRSIRRFPADFYLVLVRGRQLPFP